MSSVTKVMLLHFIHTLSSVTKVSDTIMLPIHRDLLHVILAELAKWATERNQPYLESLYSALFVSGYYGLLRIGELTKVYV